MPRARASVHELKITLRGIYPLIWRRVRVPSAMTLGDLHRVLQIAFDWKGEHRHRFTIDGRGIDEDREDELLLLAHASERSKLGYEYDFGASWKHDVVVEKIDAPAGSRSRSRSRDDAFPQCVAGKRAAPPDDCGGPWGYMGVLEALADPSHPDHADHLERVGVGWDAERFHVEEVNARLAATFAPRRSAGAPTSAVGPSKAPSLTTPLTDEETELLGEILQVHSEYDVSGLLGLLHAVVVAPGEVEASAWMEHVFPKGFGGRDVEDAQQRLSILLRQFNEVATALAEGRVIAPAPDEAEECRSFANGYVTGASLDASWWPNAELRIFVLHCAYLARRFELVPSRARAKLESDGDPDARICEMLGALVLGAYEALRGEAEAEPASESSSARRAAR